MEKLQEGIKELMDSGLSLRTIVKMCKDIYRKKKMEEVRIDISTYDKEKEEGNHLYKYTTKEKVTHLDE